MNKKNSKLIFLAGLLVAGNIFISAQPSGGPYGPVEESYNTNEIAGNVYFVSPNGDDKASGKTVETPTTLRGAIEKTVTGDAIVLRGGTYRTGRLVFNQGITIQPYAGEKPVLKGTYVAKKWEPLRENLWVAKWEYLFDTVPASWWLRHREGMYTPLHKFNNDMVFVDGKFLQSAGWEGEVDENSYYINYDQGEVYIGIDPTNKLVEITAFDVALKRTTGECYGRKSDGKGPTIRGITFTQYAFRALEIEGTDPNGISAESQHGKDVIGTTIENCEISYCSRVAGYLRGDHMTIRHCKISNTSTEGLFILSSNDVLLEKNIFTQNNIEQITGYYPAALKIFNQCYRVTCNDNLIIDQPYSNGIWYDVGNVDGVFTNNWLENVGNQDRPYNKSSIFPGDNAFFFEISKGATVAGNVFVNCEHGATVLNSSDVEIYNNTFVNSTVCIGRTARSAKGDHFDWHPATGPDVNERDGHILVNNLFTAKKGFQRPLVYVWQPADLCERVPDLPLKEMNHNDYILEKEDNSIPLILWSPAKNAPCQLEFSSPGDLHQNFNKYAASSTFTIQSLNTLFKSPELGNFELIDLKQETEGAVLPDAVYKMLGLEKGKVITIGAYMKR